MREAGAEGGRPGDPSRITRGRAGARGTAGTAPACVPGPLPVELARIYLARHIVGRGHGSALMRACLDEGERLGRETLPFKVDVRKLKKLGLTQSFEVGYEISPRGRAFLAAARRKRG